MVDHINGLGQIQGISSSNRTQNTTDKRAEEKQRAEPPRDEVDISPQAIEKMAGEVRNILTEDKTQTLGLDPAFDQEI